MGWKASIIIINQPAYIDNDELLKALGYASLIRIEDEPLEVVINPDDDKVYLGKYKNNLLLCDVDLPMQFFGEGLSEAEKSLMEIFPASEVCSIVLHSTVNLWGYAVIKNGRKIRARSGSADDGTFLEVGENLPEEVELLNRATVHANGTRTYTLESHPNESFSEDQVGENFVFAVCSRYFGEPLDSTDDLLFETVLTGYLYSNPSSTPPETFVKKLSEDKGARQYWWKFW